MNAPSAATIEAIDRAAAVRELMRRGETPVSIEALGEGAMIAAAGAFRFKQGYFCDSKKLLKLSASAQA